MKVTEIASEDTRRLRHKVLWPHIDCAENCVIDIDKREDAIHLGAWQDGRLVGICSLFEMTTPKLDDRLQYRLRAMATDPDVRGRGAGVAIVEYALALINSKGYDVLWCDARKVALGFYDRMGFERIDHWYEVRNIGPHQLMFYRFHPLQSES